MTTTTTSDRWIDLDGAANVRDLGGLPLRDGRGTTAANVVIRADNLQDLSRTDVARLVDERRVRTVIDLRTGEEVALEGPGPLTREPRVRINHRSLYPEAGERTDLAVDGGVLPWHGRFPDGRGGDDETPAVRTYLGYLRDRPDSVVGALRDVACGDGAVVVHCAAGKDRTGIVCAFALEAAGAERDAVVADYAATGDRLEPLVARLAANPTYARDMDHRNPDTHRPRPETMARILAIVDRDHGSVAGWLAAHGLADDELAALRRRLAGAG